LLGEEEGETTAHGAAADEGDAGDLGKLLGGHDVMWDVCDDV
jgi:hypothetical protein